jgi:hypothetical protein
VIASTARPQGEDERYEREYEGIDGGTRKIGDWVAGATHNDKKNLRRYRVETELGNENRP